MLERKKQHLRYFQLFWNQTVLKLLAQVSQLSECRDHRFGAGLQLAFEVSPKEKTPNSFRYASAVVNVHEYVHWCLRNSFVAVNAQNTGCYWGYVVWEERILKYKGTRTFVHLVSSYFPVPKRRVCSTKEKDEKCVVEVKEKRRQRRKQGNGVEVRYCRRGGCRQEMDVM